MSVNLAENSKFEKNIFLQPSVITEILNAPRPDWMDPCLRKPVFFVGTGTSYHAAEIAKFLWRQSISPEAYAVQSFDFVRISQPVRKGDLVVLFSHRGTKTFTVQAAEKACQQGAVTLGITAKMSSWEKGLTYRLETCEPEEIGVFSKSFTAALAWIIRWIDNQILREDIQTAVQKIHTRINFPLIQDHSDVVLIGDLIREWVAKETALKLQEAAYLPARAFGLEEFLHGPRLSLHENTMAVGFINPEEERWNDVYQYFTTIGLPFYQVRVDGPELFPSAAWLWQIFWGQRFTLEACRQLGINPDTSRNQEPDYKIAREHLAL
jgi:glucosamine--fructose-6-phosphate aminotransferase (isomerizing)